MSNSRHYCSCTICSPACDVRVSLDGDECIYCVTNQHRSDEGEAA